MENRGFIDWIRREKFGIGETKSNPLAGMLNEAIAHLSAELYQKDTHFISELLQNAEDNVYEEGEEPSLELILTKDDIAQVGASATLILFNNEKGFQRDHIEALCAVGLSTKKGKRNSGYIGEKGIGFKSVFLVTKTPYVISNGFRFRFTDDANNEAKIGYVVPEWVDVPTDADLRRVYGSHNLPQTMIILPLRKDKVHPVIEQLKQVSPETLLFLSKLQQLTFRGQFGNNRSITRLDVAPLKVEGLAKVGTVKLSVGSRLGHVSEQGEYFLLQQQYKVTHPVEQRKEVESWCITVAFPLGTRVIPGQLPGDIYAFLPSYLSSGFPFVVNADFLLVSSRETLKFDSPWNIGILNCVPLVFLAAFNYFLRKSHPAAAPGAEIQYPSVDIRQAYYYIPLGQPGHPELLKLQNSILSLLRQENCVLIDVLEGPSKSGGHRFCKPQMARLVSETLRYILEEAANEEHPNPAIGKLKWYIVDCDVQEHYDSALLSLGAYNMTETEYREYFKDGDWLLSLSEILYWQVVFFVLGYCRSSTWSTMRTIPVLKYCKADGSICLASVQEALTGIGGGKIYFPPPAQVEWLSKWTSVFKPWVSVLFMPVDTVESFRTLQNLTNRNLVEKPNETWSEKEYQDLQQFAISDKASQDCLKSMISDLSVKSYLQQLLALLPTSTDPNFIILTTEFMYQCVQRESVETRDCYVKIFPVVDPSGVIRKFEKHSETPRTVLLPANGSKWPKLSLSKWSTDIVVMSDNYISIPSLWASKLNLETCNKDDPFELESYRTFLRTVVGASDIPEMVPPVTSPWQMPKSLRAQMTIEQANLMIKWLTTFFSRQVVTQSEFVELVKGTEWLPTEEHGRRRPSSCFDKSAFGDFFQSFDLPCVHPSITPSPVAFQTLGVVTKIGRGCDTVVSYMAEMAQDVAATKACNLGKATRLYKYLQKFVWKPTKESPVLKVFVPGTPEGSPNRWKVSESCILHNVDGYFSDRVTVLEDLYPKELLPFFAEVLKVPKQATVEKYCELWMNWRADIHEITLDECAFVWKLLYEKWSKCEEKVWQNFVNKAWVPSKSKILVGSFHLTSPRDCFIPDDLELVALFEDNPKVQFVWYPDNTEKTEKSMNRIYLEMGVKKFSACVQKKLVKSANPGGDSFLMGGNGILCPEFFKAILGFLSRRHYELPSSERQRLISPLKSIVQITITKPLDYSYTLCTSSSPVVVTKDNVMALWSKTDRKFYILDKENPLLKDSLMRRMFRTQLAAAIAQGLLPEHPWIAAELTEFIIILISSGFEDSHVEYELRRKNARLFEEDEIFLSQLKI